MTTPDPSWVIEAKKNLGVKEVGGTEHNPMILQMGKDAGIGWYVEDETPWCAVAMNAWLKRAGYAGTKSAMARSFSWAENSDKFEKLARPRMHSIVVLWRGSPNAQTGHVGIYMGTNEQGNVLILGGNQSNEVNISAYPVERVVGYYWPVGAAKPWVDERAFLEKNTNRVGLPSVGVSTGFTIDQATELKTLLESPDVSQLALLWPTIGSIAGVLVVGLAVYIMIRKWTQDRKEA